MADPGEGLEILRQLCAAMQMAGPEIEWPERPEEDRGTTPERWYWRRCLPVCQLIHSAATERFGLEVSLVLGMFQDPTDTEPLPHAWLELPDGTILDPTGQQMGLPPCAIVSPGDGRHAFYHSRGSWAEGDTPN